ncbi:fumarate hydratase [Methanofollis sp. W23]|uniref:fumarate hydratase n=1 Tax=Methanofollis sp. W23 TaxID=2817849 RepID=UPI001AE35C24|nr:fumarate hydratase [Methanofollis sp. W23]
MESVSSGLLEAVTAATASALHEAETSLPPDVNTAIGRALEREEDPTARAQLENIRENIHYAGERGLPLCQDTGVPVIYLTLPPSVPATEALYDALAEGVRQATDSVPLRPNVVDPLTRENTTDNTGGGMPAVHLKPGNELTITVLPKGAGAENCSRIAMLLPSEASEIARFVAETMLLAGGKPCPPVVLGIGIGATFDGAAALAKEALLLPIDEMDPFEEEICDAVNALGIGPMGLGGTTTALAVKIKRGHCHTASLPVAVNVQCWANRRATRTVEVEKWT